MHVEHVNLWLLFVLFIFSGIYNATLDTMRSVQIKCQAETERMLQNLLKMLVISL